MNAKERDKFLLERIEVHYAEIQEEMSSVHTLEDFLENKLVNKSVKMDLLQIGECVNKLSDEVQKNINHVSLRGIIDVRNYIVHGYDIVDDKIIWNVIQKSLKILINELRKVKEND